MPSAFLEVLVEAVACRSRAENNALLCDCGRSLYRFGQVAHANFVHHGGSYHVADPVAAVRQQYHVFHVTGVQEIRELVIGNIALHSTENNAVRAVGERLYSRYRSLRNGADTVVDVFHAVYRVNIFQPVFQPPEIREGGKAFIHVGARAFRSGESSSDIVDIVLPSELGVYLSGGYLAVTQEYRAVLGKHHCRPLAAYRYKP